jgi:hypothetical protein
LRSKKINSNILKFKLAFSMVLFITAAMAQKSAIGEWRVHLPFNTAIAVTEGKNKIYCANKTGLFYLDKEDMSLHRLSTTEGLSETRINTINFHQGLGLLVIAYENSNIDLVDDNDNVYNIADIKQKNMPGAKEINGISFVGNLAYLSCGFGIVVLDLIKKEIKDTWYIGPNGNPLQVYDVAFTGKTFFAATKAGLYQSIEGSIHLSNYKSWFVHSLKPKGLFNSLAWVDEKLFAVSSAGFDQDTVFVYSDNTWSYLHKNNSFSVNDIEAANHKLILTNRFSIEIYDTSKTRIELYYGYSKEPSPAQTIIDKDGIIWIADLYTGLVECIGGKFGNIMPNGPYSSNVVALSCNGNELWAASGGVDGIWNNTYNLHGVSAFVEEKWIHYNKFNTAILDTVYDFVSILSMPDDHRHAFTGTWSFGLVEINESSDKPVVIYGENNSSLQKNIVGRLRIGGIALDKDKNLWISNAEANRPLSVKKTDNTWQSFSVPGVNNLTTSNLIIDSYDQKWIIMPRGATTNKGLAVFSDNNTLSNPSDDQAKILDKTVGNGKLPSTEVLSIAEDLDGQIWVGTDAGLAVFYSPGNVFTGQNFDAEPIYIEQDGHTQYLLETESVSAIAIDGANRKWLGTKSAGVFLMSADGTEEIYHFTEENSPLLSNNISSVAINHETGEVFFGTEKGIISFMGDATEGKKEYTNVKVFPNPVRPGYEGLIAIRGLVQDANVKIADASGGLVYETFALGGQATWNGRNFAGERVSSGVYFIFLSNEDGSKTRVSKLLFMN